MQIKVRIWFDGWVRYLSPPLPSPGKFEDAARRVSVGASCIGWWRGYHRADAFHWCIFCIHFHLGWRWFGPGGNWKTMVREGKSQLIAGTEAGPFAPLFLTRALPLSTKSQCVEIFSSPGDLPESAVGPRSAIGLPESRQTAHLLSVLAARSPYEKHRKSTSFITARG